MRKKTCKDAFKIIRTSMDYIWVFIGGGLGSIIRFLISNFFLNFFRVPFPISTLFVNFMGSLIIGFLFSLKEAQLETIPNFRLFFFIGLLGGFTTFSSFSLETLQLFLETKLLSACLNIFLNLALSLIAVIGGFYLAKCF
jgi:fluoride exporter